MRDAVVFAGYFPSANSLLVAQEFIRFFKTYYGDCDFFVGANPSGFADSFELLFRHSGLNTEFSIAPKELVVDSDASAFQAALGLLKRRTKSYRNVYFFHSKGATNRNSAETRKLFLKFFQNRNRITAALSLDGIGTYSLFLGKHANYFEDKLSDFFNFQRPYFYSYLYFHTIFAARAQPLLQFIDTCKSEFWSINLGNFGDRYFFERDFTHVIWREGLCPFTEYYVDWNNGLQVNEKILLSNYDNYRLMQPSLILG